MRFFFDTEFIEDGKTIDLISIGIVDEEGNKLYLENSECDLSKASDWVKKNVIPHLKGEKYSFKRSEIIKKINEFVGKQEPEFWAYYASYDWVCLCQLWGTMMDLPKHWPMYVCDLIFYAKINSFDTKTVPQPKNEHDALADASWNKKLYDAITKQVNRRKYVKSNIV